MDRKPVLELFEKYKDETDERVARGIETNRKADGRVYVVDRGGKPVSDVKITVKQKTHDFRFGANLFMLDELETPEKNEAYKELFKDLFNMATLPFYWKDLEPAEGQTRYAKDSPKIYRRPAPDLCIEFCRKYGIEPREHALAYEHIFPDWLARRSVDEIKKSLENRFREISEHYADKIPTIEVSNEMFWQEGKTAFYREDDYLPWCYKTAERYFPHNTLCINEWNAFDGTEGKWAPYYLMIEKLLRMGCRIDAVGMQFHMFNRLEDEYKSSRLRYDPRQQFKVLDTYGTFGKEIQITEVTIPAYTDAAADEEMQAKILEYLYPIWFSHKNMTEIIYWNLVDGYAAFAPQGDMTAGENYYRGGLVRFDLTPKPAYVLLKDLFSRRWHTETIRMTGNDGSASFRGFCGDYAVTAEKNGHKATADLHLSGDMKIVF